MQMNIRSSYDSFRDLRENESYYVDKTAVIEEYLVKHFEKAVLFTRPRRFGKTLTMTMFRDFLDVRQDSLEIFKGLEIMGHTDVVEKYMNKYPVVFLSLKEVFGQSFEAVLNNLKNVISTVCKNNTFLLDSDLVDEADKKLLDALRYRKSNSEGVIEALDLLSRMLTAHYGKQTFVIIDEYDVPMARAMGTAYYEQVRDLIEHMLSYVCKTNENVKAVMLSGCLYAVKNSTYTGVNNIIPYTIMSPIYASAIGFNDADVWKILEDADYTEHYDIIRQWYDGYLFGREKMFCPWDVLLYVKSLLDGTYSEAMGPKSYWVNTSETSLNLIHGFLGRTEGAKESFEQLLAGKTIDCTINENLPYHKIYEKGENLWTALLETGYLTKDVTEEMPLMPLRIPNREIQEVFREEVWHFFSDRLDNVFVKNLVNALWAKNLDEAENALNQILEATLSFYHEYREYSYHLILDGFFTGLGYNVLSELETGYGRSDLIILDPARKRAMVLELKHVKDELYMDRAAEEASEQITDKKYESQLKYYNYATCLKYGMAFCGKKVRIWQVE